MLKKCGCGKLIPQGTARCPACVSRHMVYNRRDRDAQAAAFYNSREWRIVRAQVLMRYACLDLYAFYIDNTVITADMVHHIEELRDCWDKRLDPSNLIPLNSQSHNKISAQYNLGGKPKKDAQNLLRSLLTRYASEVREANIAEGV